MPNVQSVWDRIRQEAPPACPCADGPSMTGTHEVTPRLFRMWHDDRRRPYWYCSGCGWHDGPLDAMRGAAL